MTTLFVPGIPVPKGSTKAFWNPKAHRVVTMQDNREKQKPWSSLVSYIAREAGLTPVSEPCRLGILFLMPRPKAHMRTNGELKPAARSARHTKKPDLDKLVRCILDALSGIAYVDDSQVVKINADKMYATDGVVGCEVVVEYQD